MVHATGRLAEADMTGATAILWVKEPGCRRPCGCLRAARDDSFCFTTRRIAQYGRDGGANLTKRGASARRSLV